MGGGGLSLLHEQQAIPAVQLSMHAAQIVHTVFVHHQAECGERWYSFPTNSLINKQKTALSGLLSGPIVFNDGSNGFGVDFSHPSSWPTT